MRLRTLGAAVAALLAVAGLAGCRTNVGTAAVVNGHRISESDVNHYVRPQGADPAFVAQVQKSGQTLPAPRSFILHYLIQEQVFERTLAYLGHVPSEGTLASYHDAAVRTFTQIQATGSALDREITRNFTKAGMTADFTSVFLRTSELEYAIIKSKHLTQLSQLAALVKRAGVQVSVSPRYGRWKPNQLALSQTVSTPAYLSVQPGAPNQGSG